MTELMRLRTLLLLLPLLGTGCMALEEHKDECCRSLRDQWDACCAWHRVKACYADEPYLHAFGEGFRAGYIHIANGGNGCPPLLPPRKYWGGCCWYPGCHGQAASVSWFNGFSQGVVQALYDGVAGCNQIVTSRDLYGQCQGDMHIDIEEMMNHARQQGGMYPPTLDGGWNPPTGTLRGGDTFEESPIPLPYNAYEGADGVGDAWNPGFFETVPPSPAPVSPPHLEPVETLPTETVEDAVTPAVIEFLRPVRLPDTY